MAWRSAFRKRGSGAKRLVEAAFAFSVLLPSPEFQAAGTPLYYRPIYVPGTQRPYWDPLRDSAKLSDMFILQLLEGPGGTRDPATESGSSLARRPLEMSGRDGATPRKARLRRLSTAELEALIPGRRVIYQEPPGSSLGNLILTEMFYKRPSAYALDRGAPYSKSARAYLVQYPSYRTGGDYFIRDNAICVLFTNHQETCRSIFKDGTHHHINGDNNLLIPIMVEKVN